MSQKLINHSPDIKKLWDEGYEIEVLDGYLLVRHIPYVNSQKEIKYGILVSPLNLSGHKTQRPKTHVAYLIGETPCNKDGQRLERIINSDSNSRLTDKILVNFTFSSKPEGGYSDYFEKMTTYARILSTPAKSLDPTVTEKTFKVIEPDKNESVLNYYDTNSAQAEIHYITKKLENQKLAIIGLGGTGSYILDLVAKTPVDEIHLYDGDYFLQNNAFRAPGAPSAKKLRDRLKKTDYFKEVYSRMHRGIVSHPYYIDNSNIDELSGKHFAFLSLDKGEIKAKLVDFFHANDINFIDVGMGLEDVDGKIRGTARVTLSSDHKKDHISNRIPFTNGEHDEYSTNIQIADLNALNATLAVIKWKKVYNFYHDFEGEHHSTYTINTNLLTSDDARS